MVAGLAFGCWKTFSRTWPPGSIRLAGITPPPTFGTVLTKPPEPTAAAFLKSPARISVVGTQDLTYPVSSACPKYSKPAKKNTLSRFLLKFVPGMRSGPLIVKPG